MLTSLLTATDLIPAIPEFTLLVFGASLGAAIVLMVTTVMTGEQT